MVIKNESILERQKFYTNFEKNQKNFLKNSGFSLWLDSYDDIFSDFDPRPNSIRALSQDFLDESKRAVKFSDKDIITLNILIDEKQRDTQEEEIIIKRLEDHFSRHFKLQKKERTKIVRKGLMFVIIGVCLLFLATFFLVNYGEKSYFLALLLIIMEPAGWFFSWEGLNLTIFTSKEESPDYDFYQKMSNCKIKFDSY